MPKILELKAKEIFDSRGTPTISVSCILENGKEGEASVPSGASTGTHEACELRDSDKNYHNGKGVYKAIANVNTTINDFVKNQEWTQNSLDDALINLDGTKNKSNLGANAILGVSMAFARACAKEENLELYEYISLIYKKEKIKKFSFPKLAFNIINGGKHADSGLCFQEFMIIPIGFKTVKEKFEVGKKIVEKLKENLEKNNLSVKLGDEGGFAPKLTSTKNAILYLENSIKNAGFDLENVKIGLDVASTTFYKNGKYHFENKILDKDELINFYKKLLEEHNIISIEDGLMEEDFEGFKKLNEELGSKINIVGDDLTVTNTELIKKAIQENSINTVLIKLNQIGTLTETLEAIHLAKENNIKTFISHRSGETLDTFISDLAIATNADFIKAGSTTKEERIVKYERLIEIEEKLS